MSQNAVKIQQSSDGTCEVAGQVLPFSSVFEFDTDRWDLRTKVAKFFGTDDLENLHQDPRWNPHKIGLPRPNHTITKNSWEAGKAVHQAVSKAAAPTLKSLIYDGIAQFIGPVKSHQPQAMMRVNFDGSRAILRFHADKEYGQRDSLINVWLPVTSVSGSNSMYVESSPGQSDFKPVELEYGQALLFYGTELIHGTRDNLSGSTRVSYDFRFSI